MFSDYNNQWNGKAGVSYIRNVRKYGYDSTLNNPATSRSMYDGKKIKFDIQNTFNLAKEFSLTIGAEHEKNRP